MPSIPLEGLFLLCIYFSCSVLLPFGLSALLVPVISVIHHAIINTKKEDKCCFIKGDVWCCAVLHSRLKPGLCHVGLPRGGGGGCQVRSS